LVNNFGCSSRIAVSERDESRSDNGVHQGFSLVAHLAFFGHQTSEVVLENFHLGIRRAKNAAEIIRLGSRKAFVVSKKSDFCFGKFLLKRRSEFGFFSTIHGPNSLRQSAG